MRYQLTLTFSVILFFVLDPQARCIYAQTSIGGGIIHTNHQLQLNNWIIIDTLGCLYAHRLSDGHTSMLARYYDSSSVESTVADNLDTLKTDSTQINDEECEDRTWNFHSGYTILTLFGNYFSYYFYDAAEGGGPTSISEEFRTVDLDRNTKIRLDDLYDSKTLYKSFMNCEYIKKNIVDSFPHDYSELMTLLDDEIRDALYNNIYIAEATADSITFQFLVTGSMRHLRGECVIFSISLPRLPIFNNYKITIFRRFKHI
jgi:hypothetical protein